MKAFAVQMLPQNFLPHSTSASSAGCVLRAAAAGEAAHSGQRCEQMIYTLANIHRVCPSFLCVCVCSVKAGGKEMISFIVPTACLCLRVVRCPAYIRLFRSFFFPTNKLSLTV